MHGIVVGDTAAGEIDILVGTQMVTKGHAASPAGVRIIVDVDPQSML